MLFFVCHGIFTKFFITNILKNNLEIAIKTTFFNLVYSCISSNFIFYTTCDIVLKGDVGRCKNSTHAPKACILQTKL